MWCQRVDNLPSFFIMCAMAHLSDDETVAKMGHPSFRFGPPAAGDTVLCGSIRGSRIPRSMGRTDGHIVSKSNCMIWGIVAAHPPMEGQEVRQVGEVIDRPCRVPPSPRQKVCKVSEENELGLDFGCVGWCGTGSPDGFSSVVCVKFWVMPGGIDRERFC